MFETTILWGTLSFSNDTDGETACQALGIDLAEMDSLEADDETTTVVGHFEVPASWWGEAAEEIRVVRAGATFEAHAA